jgi:hypothetical protein
MDKLTNKRLAVIKQLYRNGMEQSYLTEPMNGFCILSFHDSVEMFMKLCAEKKGKKVDRQTNFVDYFTIVPELELQAQMINLNYKRVSLKHNGSLPSNLDIEISRANTTEFFETNTKKIFGKEFSEISLISFIQFESVKSYLEKSEIGIQAKNYEESILNSQIAFRELLICYEEDKKRNFRSPFKVSEDMTFKSSFFLKIGLDRKLDNYIDTVNKSLSNIDDVIKIIGFGIDYKKYIKFKLLSPIIQFWNQEDGRKYESHPSTGILLNHKNCMFCFDFVINSALKLQELDFDISELVEVKQSGI